MTTHMKTYDFPLAVRWTGGRRTIASVDGKPELEVATPPFFKGGIEGVWSPEDLLVGSIASCFAVTLVAVAERREVPLRELEITASGHVSQRDDGRLGFTSAVLEVELRTDPGYEEQAIEAADIAERGCLVAASLAFDVAVRCNVHSARLLEATA